MLYFSPLWDGDLATLRGKPHLSTSMDPFGDSDSHHKGLGMGKEGVIHRTMAPRKDVHILIPRTYECVTLHGKRDLAVVIKNLKLGKIILDYLDDPYVITQILINERRRQENQRCQDVWGSKLSNLVFFLCLLQTENQKWDLGIQRDYHPKRIYVQFV